MRLISGILDGLSGRAPQASLDPLDAGVFAARAQPAKLSQSQPDNPMQAVLDGLSATQSRGDLTFGMIIDKAIALNAQHKQNGLPSLDDAALMKQVSNLTGLDLRGVTFDQQDIDRLGPDNQLNVSGADITGSVFHPASSFEGVLIDEVTVGASTHTQHVTFDGFDHKANLSLTKGDWSYFKVAGAENGDQARHANITVGNDVTALGGDISKSQYTSLNATNANLSGLDASGARILRTNVLGGRLNGADFSGAVFTQDSRISADLIAANFEGAVLGGLDGGLDLSGSRLIGANFKGVDITHVNLNEAILRPEDLHGAVYKEQDDQGKAIGTPMTITAENVDRFLAARKDAGQGIKIQSAETTISTQVGDQIIQGAGVVMRVKEAVNDIRQNREAGPVLPQQKGQAPAVESPVKKAQSISTPKADQLVDALCQVHHAMACGNIKLDGITSEQEVSIFDELETASYQKEHDVPSRGTERV